MKIIYKTGDLLKCEELIIMQGCNAQGVMGSGVAKLLRDADEEIFRVYRSTYEEQDKHLRLGQIIFVGSLLLDKIVINAITQEFYGRDPSVVYVSYDGLRSAMREMNRIFAQEVAVAMPLIGAGLANGDWDIISQIIEEESTNFQPVVYLIDGVIPTKAG